MTSSAAIRWIGARVVDVYGARLGRAAAFVAQGEQPKREWLLIEAGRFQKSHKLVPFADIIVGSREIWVPVDRDSVMRSPNVEPAQSRLTLELLVEIEAYYTVASGKGGSAIGSI